MMTLDHVGNQEAMVHAQLGQQLLVRTTETSLEPRPGTLSCLSARSAYHLPVWEISNNQLHTAEKSEVVCQTTYHTTRDSSVKSPPPGPAAHTLCPRFHPVTCMLSYTPNARLAVLSQASGSGCHSVRSQVCTPMLAAVPSCIATEPRKDSS